MYGTTALVSATVPIKSTSIRRLSTSIDVSIANERCDNPALLISISILPNFEIAFSAIVGIAV